MSSLYQKQGTKFWYIHFQDKDGEWRHRSTGYSTLDPKETAEARILKAKLDLEEATRAGAGGITGGWDFVEQYLPNCSRNENTCVAYRNRWNWISLFLAREKIRTPAHVTYEHSQKYIGWRTSWKKKTGKTVCRNTAIYEVKTFAQIMEEATRRKLCPSNPLVKLRLLKDDPDEKPDITDEEFRIIIPALAALPEEKEWMRVSFLIGMHTGCRLRDTKPEKFHCDFDNDVLTFLGPKGGKKRNFSVPLPPALRPMLLDLRKKGSRHLVWPFQPSRAWQHFFHSLGLDHLCFHCLRVTFVTRLARKRVPMTEAMRLVNHASTTIHRIYQRLGVDDIRNVPALFPEFGDN